MGSRAPHKKPTALGHEVAWRAELDEAGYRPEPARVLVRAAVSLGELHAQQVASHARPVRRECIDVDGARHPGAGHPHHHRRRCARPPEEVRDLVTFTTRLAAKDCLSVLPPDALAPEHVAHLTSLHVVAVETGLRDMLAARATAATHDAPDVTGLALQRKLDPEQAQAVAAIAGIDSLVVVEGAAGAGKTTMLRVAIEAAIGHGRRTRVVTPTKKAADVAAQEFGAMTDSVAKLVHEHGFRWNADGVWSRLALGDTDPENGSTYIGPAEAAQLASGERIVVDEAGMIDQDTAHALLTVAGEHGASLALVATGHSSPRSGAAACSTWPRSSPRARST